MNKRMERRNETIRKYHAKGWSSRKIAEVVHISHAQVCNILNGRSSSREAKPNGS